MRYITEAINCSILYESIENKDLVGYADSDFSRSLDDRKNTFGYVLHLGSGVISWAYKKQPIVTLSSTKVEYVAIILSTCQAVWL